jgi:hypothetical protein
MQIHICHSSLEVYPFDNSILFRSMWWCSLWIVPVCHRTCVCHTCTNFNFTCWRLLVTLTSIMSWRPFSRPSFKVSDKTTVIFHNIAHAHIFSLYSILNIYIYYTSYNIYTFIKPFVVYLTSYNSVLYYTRRRASSVPSAARTSATRPRLSWRPGPRSCAWSCGKMKR